MPISTSTGVPDAAARRDVLELAALVQQEDGAPPLSDQALSRLAGSEVSHLLLRSPQLRTPDEPGIDGVTGYAQRDGDAVELVATRSALDVLLDAALGPATLVWAHGRRSRLTAALDARRYEPHRELLQLRMALVSAQASTAAPTLPAGVSIRTFVAGSDDIAWLAVNAAAFVDHPEQGSWTGSDLTARLQAPWFEATDFLLAERDGVLVGFHWTKVHPDGLGEVYVLGVAPDQQGTGLGSALLQSGLTHLAGRGCPAVLLYVDGDNAAALHVYARAGFTEHDRDVQWAAPSATTAT